MDTFMMDPASANMFDSGSVIAMNEEMMDVDADAMVDDSYQTESFVDVDVDVDVDYMEEDQHTVEVDMMGADGEDVPMVDDDHSGEPQSVSQAHQNPYGEVMVEEIDMTTDYHPAIVEIVTEESTEVAQAEYEDPGNAQNDPSPPQQIAQETAEEPENDPAPTTEPSHESAVDDTPAEEVHQKPSNHSSPTKEAHLEPTTVLESHNSADGPATQVDTTDQGVDDTQDIADGTASPSIQQFDPQTEEELTQEAAIEDVLSDQSSTTMKNESLLGTAEASKPESPIVASTHEESVASSDDDVDNYNYPPPVIVNYEDNQVSLFCPPSIWSEDDAFAAYQDLPKDYFLEHAELCDGNLIEVFARLRGVLGESVGKDDELVMHIGKLGMTIGEHNGACHSFSLRQILDTYSALCRRDGLEVAYPLEMDLYPQPSFSGFMNLMTTMLEEGMGFGDYLRKMHSKYPDLEYSEPFDEEEAVFVEENIDLTGEERPVQAKTAAVAEDPAHSENQQDGDSPEHVDEPDIAIPKDSHEPGPAAVETTPHSDREINNPEGPVRAELSTTADDDLIEDEEADEVHSENAEPTGAHNSDGSGINDAKDTLKRSHDSPNSGENPTVDTDEANPNSEQPSAIPVFDGGDEDAEAGDYQQEEFYHEVATEINDAGDVYTESYIELQSAVQEDEGEEEQQDYEHDSEREAEVHESHESLNLENPYDFETEAHDVSLNIDSGPDIQASHVSPGTVSTLETPTDDLIDSVDPPFPELLDDDDDEFLNDDSEDVETRTQDVASPGRTTPQKRSREIDELDDDAFENYDKLSKRPRSD
ncbi:hypothetical protein EX30DRAFT_397478 [Ascodesmis nigricans]|uniref:Uncharacterized protein n=1 Tax=Ascodesmis nigricans TaxID=341454 RepID=A0A4S2MP87_9PEZI|nr:hypothetical protein EX30DRAFT_397478 [Ascodesmis nigricans]